jgi:small subunit ribosomal protein S3
MGQKTNPFGFRLGTIKTWDSKWYALRNYAKFLHEDLRIKKFLKGKLFQAGISKIDIERAANKDKRVKVNIYTSRPGHGDRKKGC